MTLNPVAPLNARVPEWTFGERLRKARRELQLNQEAMAERLGVKRVTYAAWEVGQNKPDITELAPRLEEVTGISRLWFVGWADTGSGTPTPGGSVTRRYRTPRKPQKTGGSVTYMGGRVLDTAHIAAAA